MKNVKYTFHTIPHATPPRDHFVTTLHRYLAERCIRSAVLFFSAYRGDGVGVGVGVARARRVACARCFFCFVARVVAALVFGFIAVARRPSVACLSRHHTWRFVFHVTKRVAPRLCARCRDFTWRRASGARARARTRARVAVHSRCAVRCARDRGAPWAVATARARERERGVHERRWRIVCVRLIARAQTRGDGERARRTRREALEV